MWSGFSPSGATSLDDTAIAGIRIAVGTTLIVGQPGIGTSLLEAVFVTGGELDGAGTGAVVAARVSGA